MEAINLYHTNYSGLGKLKFPPEFIAQIKRSKKIEKEGKRISKQVQRQQKALKYATGFIGKLNKRGVATLPLTPTEEKFRQASIAGDFLAMNQIVQFSPKFWSPKTPIGKYRFVIQNGRMIYLPFSDVDLDRFISGPWFILDPITGLAPLVHPRRIRPFDLNSRVQKYKKYQAKYLRKYRNTDSRHVLPILPGHYQIGHGIKSTWVRIRAPVVAAVAIVAAVYLGPMIMDKVGGYLAGGGSGTATATETATFVSKVKNAVTIYNKANTVASIVQGKIPPPPIGLMGGTFKEVAFNLVKKEIKDAAMNEAMDLGIKYVEKKMTEKEERKIKAEIAELQKQMDALVPKGTPIMPALELPEKDREKISEIQVIQAKREQNTNAMVALGIGAGIFLMAG